MSASSFPGAPPQTQPKLVWHPEGHRALSDAAQEYRDRVKTWAEAHCASSVSTIITAESVKRARDLAESQPPGLLWAVLDLVATVLIGFGVNMLTAADTCFGRFVLATGCILMLVSKTATYVVPHSDWFRRFFRLPSRT